MRNNCCTNDRSQDDQGVFIVSLDFELFWGHVDKLHPEEHSEFEKIHTIVPRLCALFQKYHIHATWGVVGGMLASNDDEFLKYLPRPVSEQTKQAIQKLGIGSFDNLNCSRKLLYAPELVRLVAETPGQEIGTHTYSHYYTEHERSSVDEFEREIKASIAIMNSYGYCCDTVIFPRNQVSTRFLPVLQKNGLYVYRGSHESETWIGRTKRFQRFFHIDAPIWILSNYLPLSKSTYKIIRFGYEELCNIKSSRLFKPAKASYGWLEKLKVLYYKSEMTRAAKKGEIYHIWFHPFNMIQDTELYFDQLESLFRHFQVLQEKYEVKSFNMKEAADYYREKR